MSNTNPNTQRHAGPQHTGTHRTNRQASSGKRHSRKRQSSALSAPVKIVGIILAAALIAIALFMACGRKNKTDTAAGTDQNTSAREFSGGSTQDGLQAAGAANADAASSMADPASSGAFAGAIGQDSAATGMDQTDPGASADSEADAASGANSTTASGSAGGAAAFAALKTGPATVIDAVAARTAPSYDAPQAGVIQAGESYNITGSPEAGWYSFDYNGETAYVNTKYLLPNAFVSAANVTACKAPDMTGIDPSRPMVALTYDDGPKAESTNMVLDVLEQHSARATFFLMGLNIIGSGNDCVRRAQRLGCELGNHTYGHENIGKLTAEEIRMTVRKCDYMLEETLGVEPSVLRPPGGGQDEHTQTTLAEVGHPIILWSIDTLDWDTKDPENTYKVIMENVRDGDIILMHDTYTETAEASARVVPALLEQGYQLVTVSQLAYAKGKTLEPGKIYRCFW
ncbi:MAG: polysaccharide deacetylase family protein [Eubacteriales bacterium]|nr:polysaccharide deacetylase family protein [Eubacteriales bacterium]